MTEELLMEKVPTDRKLSREEIDALVDYISKVIKGDMERTVPLGPPFPFEDPMVALPKEVDAYCQQRRTVKRVIRRARERGASDEEVQHLRWEEERLSRVIEQLLTFAVNDDMRKEVERAEQNQKGRSFREHGRLMGKRRQYQQVRVKNDLSTELKGAELLEELATYYEDLHARRYPQCDVMQEVLLMAERPQIEP